jgi:hypothetical protein
LEGRKILSFLPEQKGRKETEYKKEAQNTGTGGIKMKETTGK